MEEEKKGPQVSHWHREDKGTRRGTQMDGSGGGNDMNKKGGKLKKCEVAMPIERIELKKGLVTAILNYQMKKKRLSRLVRPKACWARQAGRVVVADDSYRKGRLM